MKHFNRQEKEGTHPCCPCENRFLVHVQQNECVLIVQAGHLDGDGDGGGCGGAAYELTVVIIQRIVTVAVMSMIIMVIGMMMMMISMMMMMVMMMILTVSSTWFVLTRGFLDPTELH